MVQANQGDVIALLAENEETLGRLYLSFAIRFAEFKDLWNGLAGEEKNHAKWILNLGEKVRNKQVFMKTDRFKAAAVRTFINHTEEEIVKANKPDYQSINALSVAYYIEESLIERKYFEVFESDSVELKQLLLNLAEATKKHAQTIRTAWDKERQRAGKK
jgi:rubrerythrin